MERNFYIFSNGRLKRKDNTLFLINEEGEKKVIPIETVRNIYLFGETDLNTKLLCFLDKHDILLHVFNYYGYYSGSFVPRESLLAGEVLVKQVKKFTVPSSGLGLARETLKATTDNILKNLKYYTNRGKDLSNHITLISDLAEGLDRAESIDEIMGYEGNLRKNYYETFPIIIDQEIEFSGRKRRPPDNMINTLISFGNSVLYTTTLCEIFKTQLNPTISFLHKPGYRRYSLALDISEIFKPLLVDRIIFRVLNRNMITEKDFDKTLNFCYMKDKARKVFMREFDSQLEQTIMHRKLKRHISYRYLIRLECYKLIKFLIEKQEYEAFRIWW
ncbi:MAG: type I-B CRISPR-associated endonuclease Cas1b [Candidatus Cloacimonetes bacterium]|nr:type I-B CRISPR-associated endonuclease Cas1b [Candidatus Cloacimonadota bacterium]